jgi:hypothetical protein
MAHSVGYGEQKDIMPVVGQATPTINYYVPFLHDKYGVPDIQRAFEVLGVEDYSDFYTKICSCLICKGVIKDNLENFEQFGEKLFANAESKKKSQTADAAKRARYHYLLVKIQEKKDIEVQSIDDIRSSLDKSIRLSSNEDYFPNSSYLKKWRKALN